MAQKIRLSEDFLKRICRHGYDHGMPVDSIRAYATLGSYYYQPSIKIIMPRGDSWMACWFTLRAPKRVFFKGYTMQELCKKFYAVKNADTSSQGAYVFKYYK